MDPTLITACQMFLVPRHLAHASRRGQMEAAGFLDMSVEMLDRVYGHHHPDYLRSAARLIGYRRRETVPISVPVTLPTPGPATQAIEIMSGPGRARTSNQTVMSGPVSPESSNKIDVFRPRTWPANMHARGRRHRDRRTASIPAMAAAAAKNIAKRSASYAHASPRHWHAALTSD